MNESDVTLGEAVARGSEGEVWKGELRGHGLYLQRPATIVTYLCIGTVAIKMATGVASTFDAIRDPVVTQNCY